MPVCLAILIMSPLFSTGDTLLFSGYDWTVKSSESAVGPGPNFYSRSPRGVFVDGDGKLHLRIFRSPRGWECSEVVLKKQLGYGTYRFKVETPPENLDDRAILGLFTYSDDPEYEHREIDVEISRWGDPASPNAQFVVQPYQRAENIKRFEVPKSLRNVEYEFSWKPGAVSFRAVAGSFRQEWKFAGKHVPVPKDEAVRINLWLLEGKPPSVPRTYEVVISRFSFVKR